MLSAQTKRLREAADDLDFYTITRDIHTASMLMREAADTIDELRVRCQELQEREWQTCHLVTESKSARDWPNNERCDHCGEYVAVVSPERVSFCPSCGRRVVV